MSVILYSTAIQTVPLLLIALFLDRRRAGPTEGSTRSPRLQEVLDRLFALLGCVAFMVSLLVIAEAVEPGVIPAALVIASLAGSIGLLLTQIWSGFDQKA